MAYSYAFPEKTVAIPDALDHHVRTSVDWASHYQGLETNPLVVLSAVELTETQQVALTALIDGYADPAQWLTFDHTTVTPMHSHYTTDASNVLSDGLYVLQTLIFANQNSFDMVLDAIKTVVEYHCPNPVAFGADTEEGYITLQIFDLTRSVVVCSQTVALGQIADDWNALALANSTTPVTAFRTAMFYGIAPMTTGYDCVWQVRGSVSNPASFTYRINSLQYLFYNVQTS